MFKLKNKLLIILLFTLFLVVLFNVKSFASTTEVNDITLIDNTTNWSYDGDYKLLLKYSDKLVYLYSDMPFTVRPRLDGEISPGVNPNNDTKYVVIGGKANDYSNMVTVLVCEVEQYIESSNTYYVVGNPTLSTTDFPAGISVEDPNVSDLDIVFDYVTKVGDDVNFTTPPKGVLAPIVEEAPTEGILQEIVEILPIVIVIIVGLIGLRKALALLYRILHMA